MTIGVPASPIEQIPIECPAAIGSYRMPTFSSIKSDGMVLIDWFSIKNRFRWVAPIPVIARHLVCLSPMVMPILSHIEVEPILIMEELCATAETGGMISDEVCVLVAFFVSGGTVENPSLGLYGIALAAVILVMTRWVPKVKDWHPIVFIAIGAAVGVIGKF